MSIFTAISDFYESTHLHEQVVGVDYAGLFTNPWFMVPFVAAIGYLLYKKSFKDIVLIAVLGFVWWASGTDYMGSLIVNNELQMEKILPVVFGGAAALGLVIYILFGRSD